VVGPTQSFAWSAWTRLSAVDAMQTAPSEQRVRDNAKAEGRAQRRRARKVLSPEKKPCPLNPTAVASPRGLTWRTEKPL
jgi:hypothetical protein